MNGMMIRKFSAGLLALVLLLTGCRAAQPPSAEHGLPETYDEALWLLAKEHGVAPSQEEESIIRAEALRDAADLGEDVALLEKEYSRDLMEQKLRDALFPDVYAEDTQVQEWYQARVSALEQAFEKDPGLFKSQQEGYDLYGGIPPLVIPEGYVRFSHILTSREETALQVWEALEAGQPFDTMLEQYGEDPGIREAPFAQVGYLAGPYPSARDFMPELKEQVLALEQPGEYSPVFSTGAGFHIVLLLEKQPGGTLPLEEVREPITRLLTTALRQEMLEQKIYGE